MLWLCAQVVVLHILGPAEPEAVRAFMAIHLPPYAVPARVLHIDAIPRNANGKLVRNELPDWMAGGGGGSSADDCSDARSSDAVLDGVTKTQNRGDAGVCLWLQLQQQVKGKQLANQPALFNEAGEGSSYEVIMAEADAIAAFLLSEGLKPGNVVVRNQGCVYLYAS